MRNNGQRRTPEHFSQYFNTCALDVLTGDKMDFGAGKNVVCFHGLEAKVLKFPGKLIYILSFRPRAKHFNAQTKRLLCLAGNWAPFDPW